MKLNIAENFRAVFYAPFYALQALDFAAREGLDIEWMPGSRPGAALGDVKRGRIDAMFGGPMRVLHDHDEAPADGHSLVNFGEVVGRDPFYLVSNHPAFTLKDLATKRLGIVSEVPTPWYCLRADLEEAGIDTAAMRSAGRIVEGLTMAQQLEALGAGRLDAAQLFEPYVSRALANGKAIAYAAHTRGPCVYTTFICSRDSAAKRHAEFAALERATQSMLDWVAEKGPGELTRVVTPFFHDLPADLLRTALARYHAAGLWSRSATVSEPGFERLARSMQAGGFIKRRGTYAECVRNFGRPA